MQRRAQPNGLANIVAFFASGEAMYITGSLRQWRSEYELIGALAMIFDVSLRLDSSSACPRAADIVGAQEAAKMQNA